MPETSGEIARRLAMRAEDVCRRYLPNGKRVGAYWIAGDVRGAKGRSLFVRLTGPSSGKGAAGRWCDGATGEHGDLLDLIAASCRLTDHHDVLNEARRFLSLASCYSPIDRGRTGQDSSLSAQRLFAASVPIAGTLAATYLKARGLSDLRGLEALRFHPHCYYRSDRHRSPEHRPAVIAAVSEPSGRITGVQRTYLANDGSAKAPLAAPRKALGRIAGNAVRFGDPGEIMMVGEGVETVLSLRAILPAMPIAAALSAQNLGAVRLPPSLRRLYIAADRDEAGLGAAERLRKRAIAEGVDAVILLPGLNDFNDDLLRIGRDAMTASVIPQLHPQDRAALFVGH
ncbi:MAG TPA: DNA primase [Parvularcula sp.]|nr:DNA primase [Parvularcula sp.]